MYLFLTVSNHYQSIIEKLLSSTKISAENANKLFYHKQTIKFKEQTDPLTQINKIQLL